MKEEDRNKKRALSDFERYVRGQMSKREENAFQRKVQRDPFADEATEGYSEVSPADTKKDMESLAKRLKNRIRPVRRVMIYRIAASIAVLMLISSAFLIIQRYRTDKQISENIISSSFAERKDSAPPSLPVVAETVNEAVLSEREPELMITKESTDRSVTAPVETVDATLPDTTKLLAVAEEPESAPDVAAEKATVRKAAALTEDAMKEMSPAGATRSEMQAKSDTAVFDQPSDIAAQPVTGRDNFNRYIEENMRRPQSLQQGESVIAVVRFLVRTSGVLDSLRVISSPGEEFSTEAMRLIREGPAWKPATENGQPVDEDVLLRIVFR